MKQKKCILVVDDKPQTAVIRGIKSKLSNAFDLEFIDIRTSLATFKKDDSEDLDIEKLSCGIRNKITGKHIDIALTDFDLEHDNFTGLDIINMVHQIRHRVKFIIYSGNWNKVIKSVFGDNFSNMSTDEIVSGINNLLQSQIISCVDRTDYSEALAEHLKKDSDTYIEYRLASLLRANGNLKFESCFPDYKGKSFKEIADIIEGHSDARYSEWIDAVLAQTLAYLTKVNQ